MTTIRQNLYERLAPLLDDSVIAAKTRIRPPTTKAIAGEPAAAAEERLRIALKSVFVPTAQVRQIIKQLVGGSIGFSATRYEDSLEYLRLVYNRNFADDFPDASAICLTGLAGSGKSALTQAIARLLQIEDPIVVGGDHDPFLATHCINLSFRTHPTVAASLRKCAYPNEESAPARARLDELTAHARWRAFRDFSVLMFADECQFITYGSTSSAKATSTLLTLVGLNVPLVYVANYSLCHTLKTRPQQDRHRLLSRPIVLQPESAGTDDWRDYLDECKRVACDWFKVPVLKCEREIFQMTFGLKRIVIDLFCLAYRQMRQEGRSSVTIEDLRKAYLSPDNLHRSEVEELLAHMVSGIQPRKDLLCPFEVKSSLAPVAAQMQEERQEKIVESYSVGALTVQERKTLDRLKKVEASIGADDRPVKKPSKKAPQVSVEALMAGDAKMRAIARAR
ncbi:ATP-binding protein [Ralstonia mojiangensis]|uniref:ATP-binding protein n=1 Tax=Ralstonia mojiangensis TaxID=2953895 RepID=UPI0021B384F0|nr:ATP-binding protein [Ralstonia mojiangensis]MCT7328812.1 ATP-binding protein [Ralstonia mojiangensis]